MGRPALIGQQERAARTEIHVHPTERGLVVWGEVIDDSDAGRDLDISHAIVEPASIGVKRSIAGQEENIAVCVRCDATPALPNPALFAIRSCAKRSQLLQRTRVV